MDARRLSAYRAFLLSLVAIAVAVLVIVLGRPLQKEQRHPVNTGAEVLHPLAVDGDGLQLGILWPGEKRQHTLTLRNTSRETVTLANLRSSCTCTSTATERLEIEAGKSETIDISILVPTTPSMRSEVIATLYPSLWPPCPTPIQWDFVGRIVDPLPGVASVLEIPDSFCSDADNASTWRLPITLGEHIVDLTVDCPTTAFRVALEDGKFTNQRYLVVSPNEDCPVGPFRILTEITPIPGAAVRPCPPRRCIITGAVLGFASVTPEALLLGVAEVDDALNNQLSFISRRGDVVLDVSLLDWVHEYGDPSPTNKVQLTRTVKAPRVTTADVDISGFAAGEHRLRITFEAKSQQDGTCRLVVPAVFVCINDTSFTTVNRMSLSGQAMVGD